jgi:2-oxoglutarate ferredoxin oxidoreductase subunit delta
MIVIEEDLCKGCGLCVDACPKDILKIDEGKRNAGGYHPVGITLQDECISCALCAEICPDVVIEVYR